MMAKSSRAAIAGDAFELLTQAAGAYRAVFGTFGEHAEHEAFELRGNCQVHLSRGLGRAGHDAANHFRRCAPLKWWTSRQDGVKCGPQAVDVGPRIERLFARELFG